jgi:hypothetical protein
MIDQVGKCLYRIISRVVSPGIRAKQLARGSDQRYKRLHRSILLLVQLNVRQIDTIVCDVVQDPTAATGAMITRRG